MCDSDHNFFHFGLHTRALIAILNYQIPHAYECRSYQADAWKALEAGKKRAAICWHRGAGKDLFALNFLINEMVEKPGVYLHCFPKYAQGKRAIWNSIHQTHTGESMAYLDHFPKELVTHRNAQEMSIQLWNGSIYSVMGIDGKNAEQARGMNPKFIIMSEYAYMDPEAWYTVEPRISQNNGTALFLSTPNGQNHFYHLCEYAKTQADWYHSQISIKESGTLSEDHINNLRAEGVPEDFIQQEYYCSFTRGAEGSYYGKQVQSAKEGERIKDLVLAPDIPVSTGWDIGVGDSTAIWCFQVLGSGQYQFVHYYENQGLGLEHYIKYLEKWRVTHDALWGKHYVPHDMKNREFTSGVDRLYSARQMGMDMTVLPVKKIEDGIQVCRSLFPMCVFDRNKCRQGVKCLEFYRKKWNESLKVYNDEPVHDQWSHGADAFRMACTGIKMYGSGLTGRINSEWINETRRKYLG